MTRGRKRVGRKRLPGAVHALIEGGRRTVCGQGVTAGWELLGEEEELTCRNCAQMLPAYLARMERLREEEARRAEERERARVVPPHIHIYGQKWVCAEEGCRDVPCPHGYWVEECACGARHSTTSVVPTVFAYLDPGSRR